MVKNIAIVDVGSENNEAPKEVEDIKEEPIINEESKEVETNNIINEENNKVKEEEEHEPKQELKSKTYSTEKVECPKCKKYLTKFLSNIVITVMEYQLKKNQTLTKLFEEKLCIQHKQKNLRIMYMKKLKILFQKLMNKK